MKKAIRFYTARFTPAPEGGFTVDVPVLPGCITQGETLDEALHNASEAIELYIESLLEDGEPIPEDPTAWPTTEPITVKVPANV